MQLAPTNCKIVAHACFGPRCFKSLSHHSSVHVHYLAKYTRVVDPPSHGQTYAYKECTRVTANLSSTT
eukprot:6191051-Pleurochrysis_carterae.AAC.1